MIYKLINFENYTLEAGIYILTAINKSFEETYSKVREKEKRIFSDQELRLLPFTQGNNPHHKEWNLRIKSFQRFKDYLKLYKANINLLDLGCGNGWFCGQLSSLYNYNFYCADINFSELKQAGRVFNSEKIKFMYADIFTADFPENIFDIITINAAAQYFPDLKRLLNKLVKLINATGEVHIIDSPFYSKSEAINAKKRTVDYYFSIGFPEMADNYFHHTYEDLSNFDYRILYNPQALLTKMTNLFFRKDSPFPWIVINN
jgi:ubiquinone/menaquinone biosynthesis C-methylase UbiE